MRHYCTEAIMKTLKPKRKAKARFTIIRGDKYMIATDSKGNQIAFLADGIK